MPSTAGAPRTWPGPATITPRPRRCAARFAVPHGVEQMHADADEAARQFAAAGIVRPMTGLLQGIAHPLRRSRQRGCPSLTRPSEPDRKSACPMRSRSILCERSLVAMARNHWNQAEVLAGQARSLLDQAGLEDATVCAAQARVALHRGDVPAARRELPALSG
jgi:hypothetical protein